MLLPNFNFIFTLLIMSFQYICYYEETNTPEFATIKEIN